MFDEMLDEMDYVFGEDCEELVGYSSTVRFENYMECMKDGNKCLQNNRNEVIDERVENELHYHSFLKHQLLSRLQEIKYYSDVDVRDSRRIVAVSPDCISMIQVLLRDRIHIMVHFRSSDFDGALPVDLDFLSTLPYYFILHLKSMMGKPGYEEVNENLLWDLSNTEIQFDFTFGSLHRS